MAQKLEENKKEPTIKIIRKGNKNPALARAKDAIDKINCVGRMCKRYETLNEKLGTG